MSKKKKGKNSNYKKPNDKPVEEELSPALKTVQLILKHHIILWLLLFPPLAFYRLFKYKIINKYVGIVLAVMMTFLLVILTYSALNPTIIVDNNIENYMSDSGYGQVREVEHLGTYEEYNVADVITTTGYYTVYFQYAKDLEVATIVQLQSDVVGDEILSDFWTVYESENANKLIGQLNPAVTKFIIKNNDYGLVQEVVETAIGSQIIKTEKGKYAFYHKYYETTNVQKWNESKEIWEDVMNRDYIVAMKQEFVDALNQKNVIPMYYKIQTVNSYGINANEIYYIFTNFCGNKYRVVKFNDGRINLEVATDGNPVKQEDLAKAWESYQETSKDVE